jgi:hypothetical protein
MIKRIALLLLASVLIALVWGSVALAWTPHEIYQDFADNGKFSHPYTDDELRSALSDATLAQYGDREVKARLDQAIMDQLGRESFPFTGFQLMIAGIVVVVLIAGGVALRLLSKPRRSSRGS